jgi:hypothetical protein
MVKRKRKKKQRIEVEEPKRRKKKKRKRSFIRSATQPHLAIKPTKPACAVRTCGCCGKKHRNKVWIMFPDHRFKFPICETCSYRYSYRYIIDLARDRKAAGKRIGQKKVATREKP